MTRNGYAKLFISVFIVTMLSMVVAVAQCTRGELGLGTLIFICSVTCILVGLSYTDKSIKAWEDLVIQSSPAHTKILKPLQAQIKSHDRQVYIDGLIQQVEDGQEAFILKIVLEDFEEDLSDQQKAALRAKGFYPSA
jgi:hypothetical protein